MSSLKNISDNLLFIEDNLSHLESCNAKRKFQSIIDVSKLQLIKKDEEKFIFRSTADDFEIIILSTHNDKVPELATVIYIDPHLKNIIVLRTIGNASKNHL